MSSIIQNLAKITLRQTRSFVDEKPSCQGKGSQANLKVLMIVSR